MACLNSSSSSFSSSLPWRCIVGSLKSSSASPEVNILVSSCPGSSIPDLGQYVTDSLTDRHFRIWTQRVTFETVLQTKSNY